MKDIEIHFDDGTYAEKILLQEIERRQKKYWINKQGQRVDIETMDDNYLLNCLNLVRRENSEKLDRIYGEVVASSRFWSDFSDKYGTYKYLGKSKANINDLFKTENEE